MSTCSLDTNPRKFPRNTSYPLKEITADVGFLGRYGSTFQEIISRLAMGAAGCVPWSKAANAGEPTTPLDTQLEANKQRRVKSHGSLRAVMERWAIL